MQTSVLPSHPLNWRKAVSSKNRTIRN